MIGKSGEVRGIAIDRAKCRPDRESGEVRAVKKDA